MGKPRDPATVDFKLMGAVAEIMSGISSLHMEPSPIEPMTAAGEERGFLSDTDYWVAHAIEHLNVALQLLEVEINRQEAEGNVEGHPAPWIRRRRK